MPLSLGCYALLAMLSVTQAAAAPAAPDEKEIAAAIERLGSEEFQQREAATDFLWRQGEIVEPQLKAATKHPDAEVRIRAATVLERFKDGIYADTPAASAALIRQFRHGNPQQQLMAVQGLQQLEDWRTLARLSADAEASVKTRIVAALRAQVQKKTAASIEAGDFAETERLLLVDGPPVEPLGRRLLVTLCVLRGTVEEQIAALEALPGAPTADQQQLLLALHQAAGHTKEIDALAAKITDPNLKLSLALQRHDWKTAAEDYDARIFSKTPRFEQYGYSAIYHRLAGNDAVTEERLKQLAELTALNSGQAWYGAEFLLLNERVDAALARLNTIRPTMSFEILCVQQRFKEAFAIVDVKPGRAYDAAWFNALPTGDAPAEEGQQLNRRHIIALQTAFFLHQLGEKEDALAIFAYLRTLGKEADTSRRWRRAELCRIQARLGLDEAAIADAAEYLQDHAEPHLLAQVYGKQGTAALHWHTLLAQREPHVSSRERLETIRMLLRPTHAEKKAGKAQPHLTAALTELAGEPAAKKYPRLHAVIEAHVAHGLRKDAQAVLAKEILDTSLNFRAGDLLREDGQHAAAAEVYGKVVTGDVQRSLALYLCGLSLRAAGDEAAGERVQSQAMLLAIDNNARQALLVGLLTRDLKADAARVADVWLRSSPDMNPVVAKEIAATLVDRAPLQAAAHYEQMLVGLTSAASSLNEDAGYITLPHQIHRLRAKGHIAAKDKAGYRREMEQCRRLLPGDSARATELYPLLLAAALKDEADELYQYEAAQLKKLCAAYPRSARYSNLLAWLQATCRLDLDEALAQANKTLELAPDQPSYIDTLAEVHFARGEFAEAVATQRRAVELDPDNAEYRARLSKFEAAANPKAPPPSE